MCLNEVETDKTELFWKTCPKQRKNRWEDVDSEHTHATNSSLEMDHQAKAEKEKEKKCLTQNERSKQANYALCCAQPDCISNCSLEDQNTSAAASGQQKLSLNPSQGSFAHKTRE